MAFWGVVDRRRLLRQLLVGWPELRYVRLQLVLLFELREPAEQLLPRLRVLRAPRLRIKAWRIRFISFI